MDRFQYQLFMYEYTGGVTAVTSDQFHSLNGFSNLYLGWGCEDEDFYVRIVDRGLTLVRVAMEVTLNGTMAHVRLYYRYSSLSNVCWSCVFYLSVRLSSFYESVYPSFHVFDMVNHFC